MAKQSISFLNPQLIATFLAGLILALSLTQQGLSATPSLETLEKQYRQAQAKNDPQLLPGLLRQMLDYGYKSVERYKQLGDLYFFLKMDKEALDTFREQAKWANTPQTWENLSDLLIWKQHNEEGLKALETALSLDKNNQALTAKLAGKYEYLKKTTESEALWQRLYITNNKSIASGKQLIEFYLRNSLVVRAKNVMDEMLQTDPELAESIELKVLNVKINSWLSNPEEAYNALKKLEINKIPESDLEYSFDLALYGGDTLLAEEVLNRLESLGKDVWKKQLQLRKALGVPADTRKLVERHVDKEGESVELLYALYETYRAERDVENEIKILEKIIELDPTNPNWHEQLLSDYIYYQKFEQGIDLFEELVEDNENSQLARLNLARLFLYNQDYEEFNDTIQTITDPKFQGTVLDLRITAAYQQDNNQDIYNILKELLEQTPNIPPEEIPVEQTAGTSLPDDKFLDLLLELQYLAAELGNPDEMQYYGQYAYSVLQSRYQKYPTEVRLRSLLTLGEDYGSPEDRSKDFEQAKKSFSDTEFYLKYYRYLMKLGHYEEAETVLTNLLASTSSSEDSVMVAEHTFGFVSYNLSKKLFSDIIARDQNYSMGLKRLGQIGLYTDNYQEAIFYISKYLAINSFDPEAIFNLGEALYFNHRSYESMEQFEKVVELLDYPDRSIYETLLAAISHLRLENYEKALELLQAAHKKDPEDLSTKLNILETLVLLEKWQEAWDWIEKENLDDEQKKKRARELVFNANIDTEKTKEDSEIKANLKFEELKAIVDLQLALRVKIIQHLCLEGLGRDEEDLQLLEELVKVHPVNKEVLSTIGYYFLDRGNDEYAMHYLDRAMQIPPNDPILNQGYRELKHIYTTGAQIEYIQLSKTNNGQNEYNQQTINLSGKLMINELDRIVLQMKTFSSSRFSVETAATLIEYDANNNITNQEKTTATSTADSIANTAYSLGYKANIDKTFGFGTSHRLEAYLWFQGLTGYQLHYGIITHHPSFLISLDWFSDIPNHEDFDNVKAETYDSGLGFETTYAWKSMKQNYSFSYQMRSFRFENGDYEGDPTQTQTAIGFSQFLMTYPNSLDINLSYTISDAAGEVSEYDNDTNTTVYKHLNLPNTQLQTTITYQRNWSEFLRTGITFGITNGDYLEFTTDHKTSLPHSVSSNSLNLEFLYLKDKWSLSGHFSYLQETTGEKAEVTTTGNIKQELIAETKNTTIPEVGISFNYLY